MQTYQICIFLCLAIILNAQTDVAVPTEGELVAKTNRKVVAIQKQFKLLGSGCVDSNHTQPIYCDIKKGKKFSLAQCQNVCLESPRCLGIEHQQGWGCRVYFGSFGHAWRLEFEDNVEECNYPVDHHEEIPTNITSATHKTCQKNKHPCCYKRKFKSVPDKIDDYYLLGLDACGRGKARYLESDNIDGVSSAQKCAAHAKKLGAPSFSYSDGRGVGRCRTHSRHPTDLYDEWRWDWVCYSTNFCDKKAADRCADQHKFPCQPGPSKECGECWPGYYPVHYVRALTKCVDVCNTKAKLRCSLLNRHPCKPLSDKCGACHVGFKAVAGKDECVNNCDAAQKAECAKRNREPCDHGAAACGVCLKGYVRNVHGHCVDICNAEAKEVCKSIHRHSCKSGTTECGGCASGYKMDEKKGFCVPTAGKTRVCNRGYKESKGKCIPICDVHAKKVCSNINRHSCTATSTKCGTCLHGYKPKKGVKECVDVCDQNRKSECHSFHRYACKSQSRECGACIHGYTYDKLSKKCVDICTPERRRQCDSYHRVECLPNMKECGGCLKGFKEKHLKDGKVKCVDVCDADVKKYCKDTHQLSCKSGSTECGMCKHGYYRHNGDCRLKKSDRKYYAFDDCSNTGKFFDISKRLVVRCCSKEGTKFSKIDFGSTTCKKKNWHEAEEWCETQNRRLCTRQEIEGSPSCTRFRLMGCDYDNAYSWTSLDDWGCAVKGGYKNRPLKWKKNVPTLEDCFSFCEHTSENGKSCKAIDYNKKTHTCKALSHEYEHAFDSSKKDHVVADRHGHCPASLGKPAGAVSVPKGKWGCVKVGGKFGDAIDKTVATSVNMCKNFCESMTHCAALAYDPSTSNCIALKSKIGHGSHSSTKKLLIDRWTSGCSKKSESYEAIIKGLQKERGPEWWVHKKKEKHSAVPKLGDVKSSVAVASAQAEGNSFWQSTSFQTGVFAMLCFIAGYGGYLYAQKKVQTERFIQI